LLDEATSALGSDSEAVVQEALDKILEEGNQTVVVIAHRLSTIKNAERIAVMQEGKLVEIGNHNELIEKRGAYFALTKAQKGSMKKTKEKEIVSFSSSNPSSETSSRRSSFRSIECGVV
jgi:ABC-type transport system involved in cytochrome bd biosynthesis fused ATPase/permease subunit